jgi:hypothetical protein
VLDSAGELFAAALVYLGYSGNDVDPSIGTKLPP